MGLIWIVITIWFRDRIKKLWLYISFPLIIYSLPVIYVITISSIFTYFLFTLILIYVYFVVKLIKGLNIRDALIIPLLIITLLLIAIIIDKSVN